MHLFIAFLLVFGLTSAATAVMPTVSNCSLVEACNCTTAGVGGFSICAEDSSGSSNGGSTDTDSPSMRQCRYFANGTIDVPTMTVITAWVPIGSRPCIGDEIPKLNDSSETWRSRQESELRDKFTAFASKPVAWLSSAGEIEILDPVVFSVLAETEVIDGVLLGKPAQIRFRPVAARWELSNDQRFYGFTNTHSFADVGNYGAKAFVKFEVDYKYQSAGWVYDAAAWELPSNTLHVDVIERERRTLLVG